MSTDTSSLILLGTFASLVAGLATAVGALPALLLREISEQTQDVMLGFAAGVMLAASFFSLIIPGIDAAQSQGASEIAAVSIVIVGILSGALCIWLVHHYTPHEHFVSGPEGPATAKVRRVWLFVIAITLHNFPEGLAVGVSFGGGDIGNGMAVAIGIGTQNMPEGLAVALALLTLHYTKAQALLIAALTGLVEPLGSLIGLGAVTIVAPLLPWGLAFAAGAMIFVISAEIMPETHRKGLQTHGTVGLIIGIVTMMFLDVVLG